MHRCLICDDHPLVLSALARMLAQRWPDLAIDQAADFPEAEAALSPHHALVLADLSMPGAAPVAGIGRLRRKALDVPIIVFTGLLDDAVLLELIALPVNGFVGKIEPPAVVLAAIELVLAGGQYFPPRLAELALREPAQRPHVTSPRITPRQQEVLQLLAAGRSNKEIAIALGLSPATIKTHVAQAMALIGAANRAEAAARAINLGII